MNSPMVVVGILFAGLGGYTYRNAKTDVERGLRWRGFDTSKIDVADHHNAVARNAGVGLLFVVIGCVMILWGLLEWSGDLLGIAIFVLAAIGMLFLLFVT